MSLFDTFINACKIGDIPKIISLLQNPDINPSMNNNASIRYATAYNQTEVVRLLLLDSRVNAADCNNHAIKLACENDYTEIVKLLLSDCRVNPN